MRGPETRLRKRIQAAIVAAYPHVWLRKIHGGPMQNAGIPDMLGCLEGYFFGMEIKIQGKDATPVQSLEISRIIKAGGQAGIVRSPEEGLNFLSNLLKTKNLLPSVSTESEVISSRVSKRRSKSQSRA